MLHRYFIKTPWLVRKIFPDYYWRLPADGKAVYLTFDDGPTPVVTPWVLDLLKEHGLKASFFCIGSNVEGYPEIYQRILDEGHVVGNHTQDHPNGWQTPDDEYVENIRKAAIHIQSKLFRPPYGRLKASQAKKVAGAMNVPEAKIIMWDVLSADFDTFFSPQQCLAHVTRNVEAGSIVVFHDSEKAFPNLKIALPGSLEFMLAEGYMPKIIEL